MKAEVFKATNPVVRIEFGVTAKNLILVSKMPLDTNPFQIRDDKNNVIFTLRIGPVATLRPHEVVLPLPAEQTANPVVNIAMDPALSIEEVKYLTAMYKAKLSTIEKQITDALKSIEETIKTVEVL